MPRRTSFAEVSRAVTKKAGIKLDQRRRASSSFKRRDTNRSLKNSDTPRLDEIQEQDTSKSLGDAKKDQPEAPQEAEAAENVVPLSEELEAVVDSAAPEEGENDDHVVVLGEDTPADGEHDEDEDEEGEEKKKEQEAEEDKKADGGAGRRRFKKLTKKQLRLQEERLEEEREREERRRRREERKRKKELEAELARQEAPQSFDEAAFKESIYTMVKTSLGLVVTPAGDLNITVDNLAPLMKNLELDTGDEDVKDLIMEALLESYGLIEPKRIDEMILKKKIETELEELENCVDAAFAVIDQDRDGIITHNDVYRLMIHLGEVLWDNQVAEILNAADVDGDGRISKKDLFLFLLGREKSVKLEDQILSKLVNNEDTQAEAEPEPATPAPPEHKEEAPASPRKEQENTDPSAAGPATSLAATLKAAPPENDSQASERRRKMFSGYSKLVEAATCLANNAQAKEEDKDAVAASDAVGTEETSDGKPAGDETGAEDTLKPDQQEDSETQDLTNDQDQQEQQQQKLSDSAEQGGQSTGPLPSINLPGSDWSDSGHVGSEGDENTYADDIEDELQTECAPLALEAGICYLPAPEFDSVASPQTPRSVGSPSPESARQDLQPGGDDASTLLTPSDPSLERADVINSARTERTSEYDSERDGDGDSLPETSHQNLILQEIEQQVLQTKEALKAKEPSVKLKEKLPATIYANDLGDGCESVVESEIHPTYVPPCARYARNERRLSSERMKDVTELGDGKQRGDIARDEACWGQDNRSWDKDPHSNVDTLTVDEYANSTAEIISKGYMSLSSPRSASTLTNKNRFHDIIEDVFSPPLDGSSHCGFTAGLNQRFAKNTTRIADRSFNVPISQESQESRGMPLSERDHEDSELYPRTDPTVDGIPLQMRPTCEPARKLSGRSRQQAPLRRSLTCHTVTVKDLSAHTGRSPSPPRKVAPAFVRSRSFVRPRSSYHMKSESSFGGRDASASRQGSPDSRKDSVRSRNDSPAAPVALKRQQLRRTKSLGRVDSPHRSNESYIRRVYSPVSRIDSYRSQRIDSARSPKESARSRTNSVWSSHDPTCQGRETYRSGRETGRSQVESQYSRQGSCRVRSASALSTARSGGRTDRSFCDEDGDDEPEEEFQFYGPNFDLIMSQKGEPEELLRESLLRDAIFRAGVQHHTSHDANEETPRGDECPTATESRKMRISRQLERVKEMEELIKQRRERMDMEGTEDPFVTDDTSETVLHPRHNRRHPLRRARTATCMRTPHTARSDQVNALTPKDEDGNMGQKRRPRSCLARRRTMSSTTPKVVTIAEANQVQRWATPPHESLDADLEADSIHNTQTPTPNNVSQPAVHVIDLSTLLSGVSEPEPSADPTASPAEGSRGQSIRPLTRVLVAYEKARQRQAARSSRNQDTTTTTTTTSISRQLQQGIPYRPPTPPQDSEPSGQSLTTHASCRVGPGVTDQGRSERSSGFSRSAPHVRKCSFMLSAVPDTGNREQSPMSTCTVSQKGGHHAWQQQIEELSGESVTSDRGQSVSDDTAMTFEFPERSVCVVRSRSSVGAPSGRG